MPKQQLNLGKQWYVLHTYSGYEENVARNLKQRIESFDMEDKIFEVFIPTETKIKIRSGKRKLVTEKLFPGYVMVQMIVTDDSWYIVRNTPNVTGFVGAGTTPTPIDMKEVAELKKKTGIKEPKYKIEFNKGELVQIIDEPFKGYEGKVAEVDETKGKVKVMVSMFGRETPVELDFLQVKKM